MKPRWPLLLVPVGVLLVGLSLVGVGGYQAVDNVRFPARAEHANGVVVDLARVSKRESRGSGDDRSYVTVTYYHPVVRFLTAREQVVEFRSNSGSSAPTHQVGASVKVLYDPDNPHKARIDSLWERLFGWFWAIVFLLIGLGATVVGGVMVVGGLRPPPPDGVQRSPVGRPAPSGDDQQSRLRPVGRRTIRRRRQGRRGSRGGAGSTPAS